MAKNKALRIIVDTNLWLSFIISKNFSGLDTLIVSGDVILLFSWELLEELTVTIKKPKLKKYFQENALTEMLAVFEPYSELISVTSIIQICRDPRDNFLLELAKDGMADFLLTGDKDLLEIKNIGKTAIVKIVDFLSQNNI